MRSELVDILRCPTCNAQFELTGSLDSDGNIETGTLKCAGQHRHSYSIVDSIPRFVPAENYASNFGFQWNKFRLTQLDSHSGAQITRDRFFASTGWNPKEMKGRRVLDIGCGAGRFTEIALLNGARVVALDFSSAVDACWENNRRKGALECIQGDVYHLPFASSSFDYVYCLGVLQHTPDVEGAFRALTTQPKPGGSLAVDVYPRLWRNIASGKDWIRPLTKRIDQIRLYQFVENTIVPVLLPVSRVIGRIPLIGRKLRHLLPVSNYEGIFPLSPTQLREWAILDTYDMLAPKYDQPQTAKTLRTWFEKSGYREVEVFRAGHLIGRGLR